MTTKPKGVMFVGMEMPENCWNCNLVIIKQSGCKGSYYCKILDKPILLDPYIKRPKKCPLREVK